MTELKLCPFCGENPELVMCNLVALEALRFEVTWVVYCRCCLTRKMAKSEYKIDLSESIQILSDGRKNVIELWNRRAEDGEE